MSFVMMTGVAAMLNLATGPWMVVSDDVMGGRSTGKAEASPDGVRFSGHLSLENNGGFSSTRTLVEEAPHWADGMRLVLKGDGRRYQARLRLDRRFDGISWSHGFDTTGEWQEIEIPFAKFEPVFRGNRVDAAGPVVPALISQVGFLLADKQEGSFLLEVQRIEFYRSP